MELEFATTRGNMHTRPKLNLLIISENLLDHSRLLSDLTYELTGIGNDHSVHSREPQPTISSFPGGRLKPSVAFGAQHAVTCAVSNHGIAPGPPVGKIVQCL